MQQPNLAEVFQQEMIAAARAAVAELYKPVQIFDKLPEVCGISELAEYYKTSNKVIAKMAKDGMPHTHVGREFRFHRSLLIDWTQGGEKPFPCASCDAQKENAPEENTDDDDDFENMGNVSRFDQNKKRNKKLANLVG